MTDSRTGDRRMGARIERSNATMLGMKTYSKNYIDACRARVDASLRAYPKTGRESAVQGVRAAFLQRSGPHSGQYVRAPAHGHRRKGWQSVERGPRPVQLNFAQPGQVAVDKLPGGRTLPARVSSSRRKVAVN